MEEKMTSKERKKFWEVLVSLTGQNIPEECETLSKTIKYPQKLYRFRKADIKSLEALRTNRLYFSSAAYYDDPFDSFCSINWNTVAEGITHALGDENQRKIAFNILSQQSGCTIEQVSAFFSSRNIKEWILEGNNIIEQLRKIIQNMQRSICFTEKDLNEVLWLKYSDNHTGFALEFDFSPQSLLIDNGWRGTPTENNAKYYSIYPVYYSNKAYDSTNYVRAVAEGMASSIISQSQQQSSLTIPPEMYWQIERISLIKHKCHEYDKEWRIIHPYSKEPLYMSWKPSGVIIGLKAEKPTRDLIISLSKEAGISNIYECYIDNKNKLNKRRIRL